MLWKRLTSDPFLFIIVVVQKQAAGAHGAYEYFAGASRLFAPASQLGQLLSLIHHMLWSLVLL